MFKESKKLGEFRDLISLISRREKFNIRVIPSLNNNHSLYIENNQDGSYCRLSIFEPKLRNLEGETFKLSNDDIDDLMIALSENNNEKWKLAIGEINDELEGYDNIGVLDENSIIPNYCLLKEWLIWKD